MIQSAFLSVSLTREMIGLLVMTNTLTTHLITALTEEEKSRVIEMAWEDRTPFEAIELQFGLSEPQVISLMRSTLKQKTFKNWRARVSGRKTKHLELRSFTAGRAYCPTQYKNKN